MLKRIFDIVCSFLGIILLSPLLFVLYLAVALSSKGGGLYKQLRIGKDGKEFYLFKFRTMFLNSDSKGLLTVGGRDPRITSVGYFLRKYKMDELPQLFNVFFGDMSLVGPRPEVKKYVDLYTPHQREVLKVRPGITDYASLEYFEENDVLAAASDPEATYINEVMPKKLQLNEKYIKEAGLITDLKIILRTIISIVR